MYHLRFTSLLNSELTGEALTELPGGWRQVRHIEIMDEDSGPDNGDGDVDTWEAGDEWIHWTLEVDAVLDGPSDRWEADQAFRDLAEHITGFCPGPGTSWSLRSASTR
jgi:hypothetical protein